MGNGVESRIRKKIEQELGLELTPEQKKKFESILIRENRKDERIANYKAKLKEMAESIAKHKKQLDRNTIFILLKKYKFVKTPEPTNQAREFIQELQQYIEKRKANDK
jgi:hypothetical protein